ncbi:hypothetical protein DFAR_2870039 [Desulfarculales bacterium]
MLYTNRTGQLPRLEQLGYAGERLLCHLSPEPEPPTRPRWPTPGRGPGPTIVRGTSPCCTRETTCICSDITANPTALIFSAA